MSESISTEVCGIVMPISSIDGCGDEHWLEVKEILTDAIETAGFAAHLVSAADDVGIIQKRIIQNLYENPIVVCDVSGKNPNVMFELGMRLAFDKPTIIIKDDKTSYSFDTSPIEHLGYPRDLRFSRIVDFKEELIEKIKGTAEKAAKDKNYTTFLKHFGTFKVAQINTEVVSKDTIIMEELRSLREIVLSISSSSKTTAAPDFVIRRPTLCFRDTPPEKVEAAIAQIELGFSGISYNSKVMSNGHHHVVFDHDKSLDRKQILAIAQKNSLKARWLSR